jgi:uncharacterized membrane protein YgcG
MTARRIAVAAMITAAVQLFSFRQAALGREAAARVQARWAARAGVEYTISVIEDHTLNPIPDDAKAMILDMEDVAVGSVLGGQVSYDIRHHQDGRDWAGPRDEHSRLNINGSKGDRAALITIFEDMSFDIFDAINDWIDDDDEAGYLGAESDYYQSLSTQYQPRNGAMRTVPELELVAGGWPEDVRGEDWNLNGRLDPNENDGNRSWPPDEPDGVLDAGWSEYITTYSVDEGLAESGTPRLRLNIAEPKEVMQRLGFTEAQALGLVTFGTNSTKQLSDLLVEPLVPIQNVGGQQGGRNRGGRSGTGGGSGDGGRGGNAGGGGGGGAGQQSATGTQTANQNLSREQLKIIFAETTKNSPAKRLPGKINLNTVSPELLRKLLQGNESVADEILFMRDNKQGGITSLADLQDIKDLPPSVLQRLGRMFCTRSNVYTIASRGRSWGTGLEVEIIAVVDRSTIPARIIEIREQ